LEPVSVVVFASIMGMASLQLVIQAAQDLVAGLNSPPRIKIDTATWAVLAAIIGTKLTLFLLCRGLRNVSPSMDALSQVRGMRGLLA
jgi:hypothetical protein